MKPAKLTVYARRAAHLIRGSATSHRTDIPHEPGSLPTCWGCQKGNPTWPQHVYVDWSRVLANGNVVHSQDAAQSVIGYLRDDCANTPTGTVSLVACGMHTRGFCGHCDEHVPVIVAKVRRNGHVVLETETR